MKELAKGEGKEKDNPGASIPDGSPKPSPSSVLHPDPQCPLLSACDKEDAFALSILVSRW